MNNEQLFELLKIDPYKVPDEVEFWALYATSFYEKLFGKIDNLETLENAYNSLEKNPKYNRRTKEALEFFYAIRIAELEDPHFWEKVGMKKMAENMKAKLVKESIDVTPDWDKDFEKLAIALEKHKVPCKLLLTSMFGRTELEILCGWNYPEKLAWKVDDAMQEAGVDAGVSADISGPEIIKSRRIAGGPQSYSSSSGRWG